MFDLTCSIIGLTVLSPMLIVLATAMKRYDGGPVFYRGERMGLNGKPFRIFKFRTMVVDAEKTGPSSTSEDDPRITRIGRLLRKYKIDELPQLINVLKGEMSIVGPRPQVRWAVDLYSTEDRRCLAVRPGITDYASIRFEKEGEILKGSEDPDRDYMERIHPEKMRLSLEYVRTRSFWVDLKIVLSTIAKVWGHMWTH